MTNRHMENCIKVAINEYRVVSCDCWGEPNRRVLHAINMMEEVEHMCSYNVKGTTLLGNTIKEAKERYGIK